MATIRFIERKKYSTEHIRIRCTEQDKKLIKLKASLYCDGNLSEYMLYTALNYQPVTEDFEK